MTNKRTPRRLSHTSIEGLGVLLAKIDPDCCYSDWLSVLMAIFHESGGSDEGFELADEWSSGGQKYPGSRAVRSKWDSFQLNHEKPVTRGTLIWMARRA